MCKLSFKIFLKLTLPYSNMCAIFFTNEVSRLAYFYTLVEDVKVGQSENRNALSGLILATSWMGIPDLTVVSLKTSNSLSLVQFTRRNAMLFCDTQMRNRRTIFLIFDISSFQICYLFTFKDTFSVYSSSFHI